MNGELMSSDNACVAVEKNVSVTSTVKLNVPLVVGVPEIKPPVVRVRPVGNEPDNKDQL